MEGSAAVTVESKGPTDAAAAVVCSGQQRIEQELPIAGACIGIDREWAGVDTVQGIHSVAAEW